MNTLLGRTSLWLGSDGVEGSRAVEPRGERSKRGQIKNSIVEFRWHETMWHCPLLGRDLLHSIGIPAAFGGVTRGSFSTQPNSRWLSTHRCHQVCVEGVSRAEEGLHTGWKMIAVQILTLLRFCIFCICSSRSTTSNRRTPNKENHIFPFQGKLPRVLPGNLHRLENR